MTDFTTEWFKCSEGVLKNHVNIEIRQRYCFIFTKDNKVIIVSKDNKEWQFPGGHPDNNERWQSTLKREVWEETGINIDKQINSIMKLGYYLVTFPTEQFLQERYLLVLEQKSGALTLIPHENEDDDTPIIRHVRSVNIDQIGKYIPWALEVEGWNSAVKYYKDNLSKNSLL